MNELVRAWGKKRNALVDKAVEQEGESIIIQVRVLDQINYRTIILSNNLFGLNNSSNDNLLSQRSIRRGGSHTFPLYARGTFFK